MNDDSSLAFQYRETHELIPYDRNTRTHSDEQITEVAASIKEFGFTNPILIDGTNGVIAGHGRLLAAKKLGLNKVPVIEVSHLSDAQKRAYIIADNKLAEKSGWDEELLALELGELAQLDYGFEVTGFSNTEFASIMDAVSKVSTSGLTDPDVIPDVDEDIEPVSATGDVWICGDHRVMCGDSTSSDDVAKLSANKKASLIHADPPYGMGKQKDGVANDNLYKEKLDAFQMDWWRTFRENSEDNAAAYIWGNAPDLWRLWYTGGLADEEYFEFCNQIVWDKKSIAGMKSGLMLKYPIATEHCLFFKIGQQFVGNLNKDDFWDGWDSIFNYLKNEADAVDLNSKTLTEICDVKMYSHWFTKSQWHFISEKHYVTLQVHFKGHFLKPYSELRKEYEEIKGGYRNHINGIQGGMRTYFDNAHETMRDVWEFPRVVGEERHGHATPKPVSMMERIMISSLPRGGLCIEPFGGSGSTLMGAEKSGRVCYTMEMQPMYVDVIVKRWQNFTGQQATLEGSDHTFDQVLELRKVS